MRARLLVSLLVVAGAAPALAAVPSAFSVQGVLRDNTGMLQSMVVSVTVKLFDAQTGGNQLAAYQAMPVMAQDGLFTLALADASLLTELAPATQVWLEVTVGQDTFARQQVTPQLFALRCGSADTANGMPNVTDVSGQIGIGMVTPTSILHLREANPVITLQPTAAAAQQTAISFRADATSGILIGRDVANTGGQDFFVKDDFGNTVLFLLRQGRMGINTTSPSEIVHIQGFGPYINFQPMSSNTSNSGIKFSNNADVTQMILGHDLSNNGTNDLYILDPTAGGGLRFQISPTGAVSIPGNLTVGGNLVVTGGCTATCSASDARLKSDVRPIANALDEVAQLRGVRFKWKKDGKPSVGVIAQEVEKSFPELVFTGDDGMKAVDYGKLTAVLIESTKELRAENEALKARLDRIEALVQKRATR
jgi:hypothetical protein